MRFNDTHATICSPRMNVERFSLCGCVYSFVFPRIEYGTHIVHSVPYYYGCPHKTHSAVVWLMNVECRFEFRRRCCINVSASSQQSTDANVSYHSLLSRTRKNILIIYYRLATAPCEPFIHCAEHRGAERWRDRMMHSPYFYFSAAFVASTPHTHAHYIDFYVSTTRTRLAFHHILLSYHSGTASACCCTHVFVDGKTRTMKPYYFCSNVADWLKSSRRQNIS